MSNTTIHSITIGPLNIPLLEPFTIATGSVAEARNVLITIINNYDLYKSERKRMPMEDVVENVMRKNVRIDPVMAGSNGRNVPAFTVRFTYEDRLMATRVVQDLDSRFISANQTDRSSASNQS